MQLFMTNIHRLLTQSSLQRQDGKLLLMPIEKHSPIELTQAMEENPTSCKIQDNRATPTPLIYLIQLVSWNTTSIHNIHFAICPIHWSNGHKQPSIGVPEVSEVPRRRHVDPGGWWTGHVSQLFRGILWRNTGGLKSKFLGTRQKNIKELWNHLLEARSFHSAPFTWAFFGFHGMTMSGIGSHSLSLPETRNLMTSKAGMVASSGSAQFTDIHDSTVMWIFLKNYAVIY